MFWYLLSIAVLAKAVGTALSSITSALSNPPG
jgi:hypothetical protein